MLPPCCSTATAVLPATMLRTQHRDSPAAVGTDDQHELTRRGRWLLQSAIRELGRQAKSRALGFVVRGREIRHKRAGCGPTTDRSTAARGANRRSRSCKSTKAVTTASTPALPLRASSRRRDDVDDAGNAAQGPRRGRKCPIPALRPPPAELLLCCLQDSIAWLARGVSSSRGECSRSPCSLPAQIASEDRRSASCVVT
jgi:hypothetical protein